VRDALAAFLAERRVAPERVRWVSHGGPFNHSLQCDLGAQAATGDVLLFLNNDARLLDRGALQAFVDWALLDGVGTVGCRLVARSGALVGAGVRVLAGRPFPWSPPVEESRQPGHATATREVVANSFACAAIARATWQAAGPLDATWFPAGYNDAEYGLRLRRRGLRHLYLGEVACEHEPGGSRPLTDELPQILELWRRHPELGELGQAQLGTEVISAARVFLLHAREDLRSRVPVALRTAATKLLRELRGG
jgi:O-antigen biosynthesis protein